MTLYKMGKVVPTDSEGRSNNSVGYKQETVKLQVETCLM